MANNRLRSASCASGVGNFQDRSTDHRQAERTTRPGTPPTAVAPTTDAAWTGVHDGSIFACGGGVDRFERDRNLDQFLLALVVEVINKPVRCGVNGQLAAVAQCA
jgi:hypothetical protein